MGDPVAQGWALSLRRPGGNVTGMANLASELSGKRIDLVKELLPAVTRIAVLANPASLDYFVALAQELRTAPSSAR